MPNVDYIIGLGIQNMERVAKYKLLSGFNRMGRF